jgi:hypothetical protein
MSFLQTVVQKKIINLAEYSIRLSFEFSIPKRELGGKGILPYLNQKAVGHRCV